jgi:hypothetical protein
MPNTARTEETRPRRSAKEIDEDDTLREVGEDHELEFDDDGDPLDRRRDPLRQPR